MKDKIIKYFQDVVSEMKKVSVPSWEELKGTTVVVIIASIIFTLFIWFSDVIFGKLINLIYGLFA